MELDDSEGLMLGQHVYLEQDLGQESAKSGLWLEDYYIAQEDDGSNYVWAASSSNKLEKRAVTLGEADEVLKMHQIVSGLTSDDYICQPQASLEEGLPVHYNDASGEGETESMYTWNQGAYVDGETEDEFFFDEGETDFEYWDYYDPESGEGLYVPEVRQDEGDFEDIEYETDEEGFVIMR